MRLDPKRIFQMDGDEIEVPLIYCEEMQQYIYDYPDFEKEPRISPRGRPWVNVTRDNCPYANDIYNDCGSCKYFRSQRPGDLIGVCDHAERNERK